MSDKSSAYWYEIGGDVKGILGNVYGGDITFVIANNSEAEIHSQRVIKGSPYLGLNKFELEDKDKFFGREQLVDSLYKYLNKNNLLLLLGASGSGKSSLVRAGLIPKFLEKKFVNLTFVPDEDPFESLYGCLIPKYGIAKANIAREGKADTLVKVVKTLQQDSQWLIFIDQFEELFTRSHKEKGEKFIDSIAQLIATKNISVQTVLAMRSDFLDEFSPYPNLGNIHDHYSRMVSDMKESELRLAIAEPAARNGVTFEKGLVEQIISDFYQQAGSLPLLQYTLDLLWREDKPSENNRVLNVATYQAIGGVSGALQQQANYIYNQKLNKDEKKAAEKIFIELIDLKAKEPVIKRVEQSQFRNSPVRESALNKLIESRLLVSGRKESTTVEVAHEKLLRCWGFIKNLIQEHEEIIILRSRLIDDASEWNKVQKENKEKAKDELWSGSKLERVLELIDEQDFGSLDEKSEQFIQASVVLRDRQIKEKLAAAQKLAEESAARLKAEERSRIEAEKRAREQKEANKKLQEANKKLRVWSLVATFGLMTAIFGIAAGVFAVNSFVKSQEAQLKVRAAALKAKLLRSNEIGHLLESIKLVSDNQKFNQRWWWWKSSTQLVPDVQSILYQAVEESRERYVFRDHESEVNSVAFSLDGQYIVSGSRDKTVKLWDLKERVLLHTFNGHESEVNSVAFSPDGKYLVSGSNDKTLKLWDVKNRVLLHTFDGHQDWVNSVAFSPDGKYLVSGSSDNTVKLWDVKNQVLLHAFDGYQDWVNSVAFSPDGKYLVSGSDDKTVKLWDIENQALLHSFTSHEKAVNSVSFSPDGKYLVSGSDDKTVKLWDIENQALLHSFTGHEKAVNSVSFSPDGKYLVSSDNNKTVKLWEVEEQVLLHTFNGHKRVVNSVSFSPDGQYIVSGSDDKTVKLWDVQNQVLLHACKDHKGRVNSVAISPDGQYIVSGSRDKTVKLWQLENQVLRHTFNDHKSQVNSVAFSPDGQYIVSGSRDKTVKLWDVKNRVLFHTFDGHKSEVNSVAFSPDGQYIVSGSSDKTVKLWDVQNRVLLHTFNGHEEAIISVDFSSDGQYIVSGSYDKTVKLWDRLNKTLVYTFNGHESEVNSVAFSPDGQYIVSGSENNTVKLWDVEKQVLLYTLVSQSNANEEAINSVSFSPDGQYIVTGSRDKTVQLWNVEERVLLHTFEVHGSGVNSVAFSPDGQYIVSGSSDKTVQLWREIGWQDWMAVGCKRIVSHPTLVSGKTVSAQEAAITCNQLDLANGDLAELEAEANQLAAQKR